MPDQGDYHEQNHVGLLNSPQALSRMPPAILYTGEIPDVPPGTEYGFSPIFVSRNLRDILGYEPSEIVGQPCWWQDRLHPEDKVHVLSELQALAERGRLSHEYRFRHHDGHYLWIHDEMSLVEADGDAPMQLIGAWRNITLRKQAADELLAFQLKCQELFENMIDVYYKTDMDGRLEMVSPSCLVQTGYTQQEALGRRVTEFYADSAQRDRLLRALREQGQVNDFELKLVHKDGSLRYASATSHLIYDQDHRPIGVEGILRNVTERHRAEEKLSILLRENRSLMLQLMQVQEEERHMLARELHDELGQLLTGIGTRAEYIGKQASDADIVSTAHEIARDTDALFSLSHAILKRLRPLSLDTLGLAAALEELVDNWRRKTGAECRLRIDEDIDHLDENYNIAIYRLVQEALTNAHRHGKANRVDITLQNLSRTEARPHSLSIEVEDNGKGIHVENIATGMGVIGMRERVHALGGVFLITDLPLDGVRIEATIPLESRP